MALAKTPEHSQKRDGGAISSCIGKYAKPAFVYTLPAAPKCGDVNVDDLVDDFDVALYRAHLIDPLGTPLGTAGESRCSVIAPTRACDIVDVTVLRRALNNPSLPPPIDPVCLIFTSPLCGDVNTDAVVDSLDVDALRAFLAEPMLWPLSQSGLQRCNVVDPQRPCDILDVVILHRHLVAELPGISPSCPALVAP